MELSSQYNALDVSDIFAPGSLHECQLGPAVAFKIKNTKWYNDKYMADALLLERLVEGIHFARTRRAFDNAWEDFKEWADDHYVWVNEQL